MKAISLKQPWATLLVKGIKKVETRGWKTNHRGTLYIHASKSFGKEEKEIYWDLSNRWPEIPLIDPACIYPSIHEMENSSGCIIGSVRLWNCLPAESFQFECDHNVMGFSPKDFQREDLLGDLRLNKTRIAWMCSQPVMFKTPIPCKGALSVWEIPQDIQEQIKLQIQ